MENKYFFSPEKKVIKQGYLLRDESGNTVYEAKVLRMPLLGAAEFEFADHISGTSKVHKVGKTLTTETGGMLGFFSTKSRFKFDGKVIWEYLHDEGYRIESSVSGGRIGMTYEVSFRGQKIAEIETAAPNGAKSFLTSRNALEITAAPENVGAAFLVAFAIARTEQIMYD